MILYLGTSSLVKLYLDETSSDIIRDWARVAEMLATCRIAFTEVMSALDLRFRNGDLSKKDRDLLLRQFTSDWAHFVKVDFDDLKAGKYIHKYGLTRFAAIQLSSAKLLKEEHQKLLPMFRTIYKDQSDISLFFSSFDLALCEAANAEGLRVLPLS